MVLEVLADREVLPHGDSPDPEVGRRADPREHQQHRGLVRACGDDHLALGPDRLALAVLDELDADGAVALEDDPLDEHAGPHFEVRPVRRRMEEGVGRAAPHAVALRELEA